MAKRLSKALRGKRRWIGVLISAGVSSRSETKKILETISTDLQLSATPKLIDFNQHALADGCGTAVIQIPLTDYQEFRESISNVESLDKIGIMSLTTSGKIRLVRQRLSNLR